MWRTELNQKAGLAEWILKYNPTIHYLHKTHFQGKGKNRSNIKVQKKTCRVHSNQNRTAVAILRSGKERFRQKLLQETKMFTPIRKTQSQEDYKHIQT